MASSSSIYIHHGDWDSKSRAHPALKWFEPVVREIFDGHKWDTPYSELYTDDLELLKPDGTSVSGGKQAWAEVAQLFGPFTAQRTVPTYNVVSETSYGWEMVGQGWIYGDLPGEPAQGEQKVKDDGGREWDSRMSGAFRFQFVKDAGGPRDGMLLKVVHIMVDTAPVMVAMMRRGLVKVSDLGL